MHVITFLFILIELSILFYTVINYIAIPSNKLIKVNLFLLCCLIYYNTMGGLFPDKNLSINYSLQVILAYSGGFLGPAYFPYYIHETLQLKKLSFHKVKGVLIFLVLPYIMFCTIYLFTNSIKYSQSIFLIPFFYSSYIVIIVTISARNRVQRLMTLLAIIPWLCLPIIDFFQLGQIAATIPTNLGFLCLMSYNILQQIKNAKANHLQLKRLNITLNEEVQIRTKQLEDAHNQKVNTFINLTHETKTPLTLITNYLDEYLHKNEETEELLVVKKSLDKMTSDIVNFFDVEKFNKGIIVYNHSLISDFSSILKETLQLFEPYANRRMIKLSASVEENIFVNADPSALNRITNNLIENAVKFSDDNSTISVKLFVDGEFLNFVVQDFGVGIPTEYQKKIFEPYFQITNKKANSQGMGLGLPIVKKIVEDLKGTIIIQSNGKVRKGTEITVALPIYQKVPGEIISKPDLPSYFSSTPAEFKITSKPYDEKEKTILVVEDNVSMANYLSKKLCENYNVYTALNGNEALKQLKELRVLPDLIISDVMMDKMDGYAFAKIISNNSAYGHIPFIFITAKSAPTDRYEGLRLGAIDYVQKPFRIQELLQKIESIVTVTAKQRQSIINTAFASLNRNDNRSSAVPIHSFDENCQVYNLSAREKEIAELICQGLKYKAIAANLFIAERTVTKHAQNIFEKVGVSNKVELCNKLEYAGNPA